MSINSGSLTLAHRLAGLGQQLRHDAGMAPFEALAWLTVIAGGPGREGTSGLTGLLNDSPVDARPGERVWRIRLTSLREPVTVMDRWRAAAPWPQAPLAWAAGLSPAETRGLHAAGSLDTAHLKTLATLRGYRLLDLL